MTSLVLFYEIEWNKNIVATDSTSQQEKEVLEVQYNKELEKWNVRILNHCCKLKY